MIGGGSAEHHLAGMLRGSGGNRVDVGLPGCGVHRRLGAGERRQRLGIRTRRAAATIKRLNFVARQPLRQPVGLLARAVQTRRQTMWMLGLIGLRARAGPAGGAAPSGDVVQRAGDLRGLGRHLGGGGHGDRNRRCFGRAGGIGGSGEFRQGRTRRLRRVIDGGLPGRYLGRLGVIRQGLAVGDRRVLASNRRQRLLEAGWKFAAARVSRRPGGSSAGTGLANAGDELRGCLHGSEPPKTVGACVSGRVQVTYRKSRASCAAKPARGARKKSSSGIFQRDAPGEFQYRSLI
jgi:hypothetical protein